MGATMTVTRQAMVALLACSFGAPPAAAAPWSRDTAVGFGYDSNPRNAESGDDESAMALQAAAGIGHERRLAPLAAMQLRASLSGEHNLEFDALSHGRLEGRARLRWKPGAGFFVPVIAGWVSVGGRDFGSGIRDSYDYRGGVSVTGPLTTRLSLRLDAALSQRDSASRVFDQHEAAFAASLDWTLAASLTAYLAYRHARGDLVVSARGDDVAPKTYHLRYLAGPATAIEPDDAYTGDGEEWLAYRLDATTQALTVGCNVPLGANVALDLQGQTTAAEIDGGFDYDRVQGALALLIRF